MIKLTLPDRRIALHGLPWNDEGRFHRLPADIQECVAGALWECAAQTSGARLRFRTDSTMLGLAAVLPGRDGSQNMCPRGHSGVDAYVDGVFWSNTVPDAPGNPGVTELTLFEHAERRMRDIEIYLPIYSPCKAVKVLLDDAAAIQPPKPYALDKPVVFYGTSITQGGCASRPALPYPAMLSRMLNVDFINLGFSGLGRGEPAVAEAITRLDAACVVIDMSQNNPTIQEFKDVFEPFYRVIRNARPEMPILMTLTLGNAQEAWNQETREFNGARRAHIREVAARANDPLLTTLSWPDAADMTDGIVDHAHPNDIGFLRMAEAMRPALARILGLA